MSYYMEENLNMTMGQILKFMQDRIMNQTTYFGIRTLKCPNDFWVYQEIIFETKPDVIVEIGNFNGGSTLALAHICDHIDKGRVIGIDLSHGNVPEIVRNHPRITLLEGDACRLFERVTMSIGEEERVIVIEDSSHAFDNTLNVLRAYSQLIKQGDYFIVEDSIINHGLELEQHLGPFEAVEAFVNENPDFEIDRSRESLLITWNPKGYLRRKDLRNLSLPLAPVYITENPFQKFVRLWVPPILPKAIKKFIQLKRTWFNKGPESRA